MYLLVFIPHLMVLSILALIDIFRVCLLFALLGTEGRH